MEIGILLTKTKEGNSSVLGVLSVLAHKDPYPSITHTLHLKTPKKCVGSKQILLLGCTAHMKLL